MSRLGFTFRTMLRSGFDTYEIARIVNNRPEMFPDFGGGRYPIREADIYNQIARVDHLNLTEVA